MLHNLPILFGISASIAAYKSLELIRLLRLSGAYVFPVLTKGATHFVTPLSIETLAQKALLNQAGSYDAHIAHVEAAHTCKIALIAPASANCIAKMANGLADEILYQTLLSFNGPVVIAPAME